MNWRELCPAAPEQIFLKQGSEQLSYAEFWRAVDREQVAPSEVLVATEQHSFASYIKLWAHLEAQGLCYFSPAWDQRDLATDELRLVRERFGKNGSALFLIRTSGSTGAPKFVIHNAANFLRKHHTHGLRFKSTFAFSSLHTIAGWETLFQVVATGATLVLPSAALNPQRVAQDLRREHIELFQTTPSFLQFMLLAGGFHENLPDLRTITYGSEPPYEECLSRLQAQLPGVRLLQTYGMSEIGIQLSDARALDPLSVQFNELVNMARINTEGILEVRSPTTMLGYLDGMTPATSDDGYFITGDMALRGPQGYQIRGRRDDQINVGGYKFYPAELENAILSDPRIADVTVIPIVSWLTSSSVTVRIWPKALEEAAKLREELPEFFQRILPPHMRPTRWEVLNEVPPPRAHKKIRRPLAS